jgi:hypothetical protein
MKVADELEVTDELAVSGRACYSKLSSANAIPLPCSLSQYFDSKYIGRRYSLVHTLQNVI